MRGLEALPDRYNDHAVQLPDLRRVFTGHIIAARNETSPTFGEEGGGGGAINIWARVGAIRRARPTD